MIIQPDILSHWKVRALCTALGTGEALTALLGLWSHCQNSRAWVFEFTPLMLAGICHYSGNPDHLLRVLQEIKLLDLTPDGRFEVHDWAEKNATLVRNWTSWDKHRSKKSLKTPPENVLGDSQDPPRTVFRGVDKIREEYKSINTLGDAVASQEEIPRSAPPEPPAPPSKRKPDPCFEALVTLQGSSLSKLTKSERGGLNRALSEIRAACPGLTVREIGLRAEAYRTAMPGAMLTATALAKHWSRLAASMPAEDRKKNQGGAPRPFSPDIAPPAYDWRSIHEDLYDLPPSDEWHQLQPYVRDAIELCAARQAESPSTTAAA